MIGCGGGLVKLGTEPRGRIVGEAEVGYSADGTRFEIFMALEALGGGHFRFEYLEAVRGDANQPIGLGKELRPEFWLKGGAGGRLCPRNEQTGLFGRRVRIQQSLARPSGA
jgi:hypothetical protein